MVCLVGFSPSLLPYSSFHSIRFVRVSVGAVSSPPREAFVPSAPLVWSCHHATKSSGLFQSPMFMERLVLFSLPDMLPCLLRKPLRWAEGYFFLLAMSDLLTNYIGLFFIRSCRYMSSLYSHPDFPNKGPKDVNQELKNRISSNPLRLLLPKHITNYIQALWTKKATGQPVTFTDIFGMLIGETLIPSVRVVWLWPCHFALISSYPYCQEVRRHSLPVRFTSYFLHFDFLVGFFFFSFGLKPCSLSPADGHQAE